MSTRLSRQSWLRLLAGATIIRLVVVFILLGSMPMVSDAASYAGEGMKMAASFPGAEPYFWPPGMPWLLGLFYHLFGEAILVSRLVSLGLSVAAVAAVALVAQEVTSDVRSARAAGWIAALYPPSVMMAGQTYSQLLAMLALTLLAYWMLRAFATGRLGYYALAGIAYGAGALARPSMLSVALPIAVVAGVALLRGAGRTSVRHPRSTIAGGALMLAVAALTLYPALRHNHELGAGWNISTNNERNFFLGNNRFTPDYKTGHMAWRGVNELEPAARDYILELERRPDPRAAMADEAVTYIEEHPLNTLWRTSNRIRSFWGFDYVMSRWIQQTYGWGNLGLGVAMLFESGGYCLAMLLVIVGMLVGWRKVESPGRLFLVGVVLAYQLPYMISFASGIYHFPAVGLLFPWGGIALVHLRERGMAGLAALMRRRWFWIAAGIFLLIQVEYAYYTILYYDR